MIKPILIFFAVTIYFFLCFAFVNAQLNPFVWSFDARFFLISLGTLTSIYSITFYNDLKRK